MFDNPKATIPSRVAQAAASGEQCAVSPIKSDALASLFKWFGVEFHLVDGEIGELVHGALGHEALDWAILGQLCRTVSQRGRAEFLHEDGTLIVMAIPLASPTKLVAVGTFVCDQFASSPPPLRLGELPCTESPDAAGPIKQTCWQPGSLLAFGQLACEELAAVERIKALVGETQDLSKSLASTYEEIGLLYRLSQNLKLSNNDEQLGSLALGWLAEVLPVESLALQLNPSSAQGSTCHKERTEPVLLSCGSCPINADDLTQIIDQFGLRPGQPPLIVNRSTTSAESWRWPKVRELIVVSLCEGENSFGWLAAVNIATTQEPNGRRRELGTVEANLLSSVAAILGNHSGNGELYHQQRELFAGIVRALTFAIDAKDPYTCGHSDRVARVAMRLAEELGCDARQLETVYLSGMLHDVGKIGIDDDVLCKPGELTVAEYEHITTHAEIGYRILCEIKQLDEVLPVVLHHHEQWDGRGYPHHLSKEDIPFLARIVAVADAFDAMSSDRPYRRGMKDEQIDAILRAGAGQQWDAQVIAAFFQARDDIRRIAEEKVSAPTIDFHNRI